MSIFKTVTIKLAYMALLGGFALGTQGCSKKSFESLNKSTVDSQSNGGSSSGGGSSNGGSNNGGSNNGGSNNGATNNGGTNNGGSNNGATNNGGTNNGGSNNGGTNNGGTNNGGSNNGATNNGGTNNGGSNNGGTTGATNNGGSTNGSTNSCSTGCSNGGSTNGGTTGATNNGGTTNGGTTGATTNGGTTNGGTTGGTNNGGANNGGTTGGCDPFEPNCTPDVKYCITERYQQPGATITRKLDVLVITDASTSMNAEREALANGITGFIGQLPSNTDAQFAVMLAHGSTSWYSGRLYKSDFKDPKEKYVLSTKDLTNSQIQSWMKRKLLYSQKDLKLPAFDASGNPTSNAQKALPIDFDSEGEAGLLSLWNAVRPYPGEKTRYESLQTLSSEIAGERNFFREDAALAIIYISDENDVCYLDASVPDPDNLEVPYRAKWCNGLTAQKVLQRLQVVRKSMPTQIASIIYNNKATIPAGLENGVGYGYKEFATLGGGTIIDIAQGAIAQGLSSIGGLTSNKLDLRLDFILKYTSVDSSTIKVKVDNAVKTHSYSSSTNTVHLTKANAGVANSLVDIYYCLQLNKPLVPYEIQIATHLINTCKKAYQPNVFVEEK